MSDTQTQIINETAARWQPLEKIDRRVVGVLVEKAKTTPENYPLSLNALVNGCNQKSNRAPQMQLEADQVEGSLERLRTLGAVALIQGDGRVDKFRHLLYEWLGVDKVEIAVMAELLLRGAQTVGDLRGRAARMEPIKGVHELQPIVDGLRKKHLVILLTPPGRGCVVTHALYHEQELAKIHAEYGNATVHELAPAVSTPHPPQALDPCNDESLQAVHDEIATLRQLIGDVRQQLESEIGELRSKLQDLNRQLGT